MTALLKGGLSSVQDKVDGISAQMGTVKSDLHRFEEKWEAGASALSGQIELLEKESKGMDNKWESFRAKVQKDVAVIQPSIDDNSSKILDLENKVAQLEEKWATLEANSSKISELENKVAKYEEKWETLEALEQSIKKFFRDRMNLSGLRIETTYRLGSYGNSNSDRPRPLVVSFSNINNRWAVWKRRRTISFVKDTPVWLHEDLPKQLRNDNRVLQRIAKVAMLTPDKYGEVKVKDFKISINGKKFSMDTLHRLPKELSPHSVYTPRSDQAVAFFTRHSPFSNHYACNFDLEGISFSCVEQYLAVQRAYLSRDKFLARRAMESQDPADHKAILNQLRNDNPQEWRDKAPGFIMKASRAKYNQNPLLKDLLLSTHPLQIGEASRDTFWGTGCPLESQYVLDTEQWASEGNLQGKTLMSIRTELMAGKNSPTSP